MVEAVSGLSELRVLAMGARGTNDLTPLEACKKLEICLPWSSDVVAGSVPVEMDMEKYNEKFRSVYNKIFQ